MLHQTVALFLRKYISLAALTCLIFVSAPDLEAQTSSAEAEQSGDYKDYNRYVFSTNSLGVKRESFVYNNFMVLTNSLTYGVTDNISVSAGLFPGFLFSIETPVFIKPEITFPIKSDLVSVSGGFYLFSTFERAANSFGGIGFSKATLGNQRYNTSLSLGFGFSSRAQFSGEPIVGLNAHLRYSRRFAFITENYFTLTSNEFKFYSIGQRYYPGRAAIDFLLIRFPGLSISHGETLLTPGFGVSIPF